MSNTVYCAAVFSDHCVLQRNKEIRVWGSAEHGTRIEVSLNGETSSTMTAGHEWSVSLPAMSAGGPYTLTISSDGVLKQCFKDVMIGEVWLAGGQSNMEYMLKQDADAAKAMERIAASNVRFYQVPRLSYKDDYFYRVEQKNHWMLPTDAKNETWSAVGYYFAEKLASELGVTVGIIGCNLGGTSAAAWQDKDSILSHADTKIYWEEYTDLIEKQSPADYEKEFLDYHTWHLNWQPRMDAYYAAHPNASWDEAQAIVGVSRWPGPMGPKHEFRPTGLYECMLKRVVPYTLGGIIYYQGESDDHRPDSYYSLFCSLVACWRREFLDNSLPFLCVQLPIHHYESDTITDKWCAIRDAQMRLHQEGVVTGIAVALDCGEYNNIHPTHKAEVARRLAIQALYHVYGIGCLRDIYGPVFKEGTVQGDLLLLHFDYAEQGFRVIGSKITNFELAGADGIFVPADARIDNTTIILHCEKVKQPVMARYMWTDYAEITLFGANGLPVAPFRMDI